MLYAEVISGQNQDLSFNMVNNMAGGSGDPGDLNDLRFFVAVVDHGGFSAAGRALGLPKSRLSQRVARLEDRLGVRLIQRSTRRFVVTEVGERFLVHCRAMLEQAQAAHEAVDALLSEPRGTLRVSCPVPLAQTLVADLLPDFLERHPRVQVRLLASNRRVDVIGEGIDIAIRVREVLDSDVAMVARTFGQSRVLLVASPEFLAMHPRPEVPRDLAPLPLLSMFEHEGAQVLGLVGADGAAIQVEMSARLICGDFAVLHEAAKRGMGIATLPVFVCAQSLADARLQVVLPEWSIPQGIAHFVYPTRRGLLPGVRALVDFLAERLPGRMHAIHAPCTERM